ncbi:hypothetical protein WOLCODRAFT_156309 [Wolfiporia cocos MD-104 SS10]|uniref:Uncharacterized protein n=1 Tax=Wolfiporia cocos (strain MD-104) TaxID=742152 RepID=A0A2H3JHW6_WOLCO|nr:hypothetical protein WOLCODRAFT_156309 [Wolfiporia cocos MD-104 SS10]
MSISTISHFADAVQVLNPGSGPNFGNTTPPSSSLAGSTVQIDHNAYFRRRGAFPFPVAPHRCGRQNTALCVRARKVRLSSAFTLTS